MKVICEYHPTAKHLFFIRRSIVFLAMFAIFGNMSTDFTTMVFIAIPSCRAEYNKIYTQDGPLSGRDHGHVTKFVILYPLNHFWNRQR